MIAEGDPVILPEAGCMDSAFELSCLQILSCFLLCDSTFGAFGSLIGSVLIFFSWKKFSLTASLTANSLICQTQTYPIPFRISAVNTGVPLPKALLCSVYLTDPLLMLLVTPAVVL